MIALISVKMQRFRRKVDGYNFRYVMVQRDLYVHNPTRTLDYTLSFFVQKIFSRSSGLTAHGRSTPLGQDTAAPGSHILHERTDSSRLLYLIRIGKRIWRTPQDLDRNGFSRFGGVVLIPTKMPSSRCDGTGYAAPPTYETMEGNKPKCIPHLIRQDLGKLYGTPSSLKSRNCDKNRH